MPKVLIAPSEWKTILRDRQESGGDRFDEVWDGVYVMSPLADNEHQRLGHRIANAIEHGLGDDESIDILHGTNISDNVENWTKNYRCPDVAVFLPGNTAEDRGSHWLGGPDFAVEVMSKGDRSRKKFDFYRKAGVRELLLVCRHPWKLELHRTDGEKWELVGVSQPDQSEPLSSAVLSLNFRLVPEEPRPKIEVTRSTGEGRWLA